MDAIVQLIRNGLCCIKDLRLFPNSILHDPKHTALYYTFPSPHLDQTTPLEVLIAITQLYACISCSLSGWKIMMRGIYKLRRLTRVADLLESDSVSNDKKNSQEQEIKETSTKLITKSIMVEASAALRNFLEGMCVLSIGISFFWLFANSLHITASGWIGGLPALIYALIVMEVALLPLLYYMLKDAKSNLGQAKQIMKLITLKEENKVKEMTLTLDSFHIVTGNSWSPFWTEAATSKKDQEAEEKMMRKEIEVVQKKVTSLSKDNNDDSTTPVEMEELAIMSKWQGYREYVYFLFNFIAFYGYLLGIVVYYYDKEEEQSGFIKAVKLGYNNVDADWNGNFAGDFMWTLEPAVILLSPMVLKSVSKRTSRVAKKAKSD